MFSIETFHTGASVSFRPKHKNNIKKSFKTEQCQGSLYAPDLQGVLELHQLM